MDPHAHGPQTTKDGKFTVEFVECLASCGTAPVMMCNDQFYEGVSGKQADEILDEVPVNRPATTSSARLRNWLPDMDLNHDKQIQSLLCYRYTIGQTSVTR